MNRQVFVVSGRPPQKNSNTQQVSSVASTNLVVPFSGTISSGTVDCDVNAALGKNGTTFVIENNGNADFTYKISSDGTTFSSALTLLAGMARAYEDISVDTIQIIYGTASTDYYIEVF